ncbi:MAG: hypothetical protein JW810_08745 [Sedimentisphaerales bacterium]|nr:hypothetical protein [Sedimentisphaerales bacterium]
MKVAIFGPICRDLNIVAGRRHSRPGGVTYYAGQAMANLGVDTLVFGTYGPEPDDWLAGFKPRLIHLSAAGTIQFTNEYPDQHSGARVQKARIVPNAIRPEDLFEQELRGLDYIVLGPLLHDNLGEPLVRHLSAYAPLVLAAQGTIRYLDGDAIVWRHPQSAWGLLPYMEYVFLDDLELAFLSQQEDIQAGARRLQELGARNVMVTQADRGSRLFVADAEYPIRYFVPQPLADPTGAGDTYLAGYLRAIELTDDPAERGEFAAMTATLAIERHGPFEADTRTVSERLLAGRQG